MLTASTAIILAAILVALLLQYSDTGITSSDEWVPLKPITPNHPWFEATERAIKNVQKLSRNEKLELVMGVGWQGGPCIGNTVALETIGFHGMCLQDSPLGVKDVVGVTAFPSGLNVAATWDKDLMVEYGKAMGKEFRELGINVQLGPAMNLIRAPAAGRNWEGPGGDPYLASISASRIVRGIQSNGVIATAKHLIGNEQEHFRVSSSSNIDNKTLMEVYLAPFEACIEEGVGAIMCSYNKLNQLYTCANPYLNRVIKHDLDFRGILVTDWYARYSLTVSDLIMPGFWRSEYLPHWWEFPLVLSKIPLVGQFLPAFREVSDARLDDMAVRILSTFYKFGQDAEDYPRVAIQSNSKNKTKDNNNSKNNKDYKFKEHADVARRVAAASIVLVKNDGVLPLTPEKYSRVAILGEDARGPVDLNENNMNQKVDGTLAQGWGSGTARFPYLVSPFEGISARAATMSEQQSKAESMTISSMFDNSNLSEAAMLASESDVSVVFANSVSGELILALLNVVEGNWGDRNNLKLWHGGDDLIEAVAAQNKRTVVVVHSVGVVDMPWFHHPNISAVVYALVPGQESGNALADVLFGDVNPSGRLPFTVLANRSEYAADVLYTSFEMTPQIDYSEGVFVDYRHADQTDIPPIVPFGHGLSYTQFEYSNMQISTDSSTKFSTITVTAMIRNTGSLDGHEVVQLYVSFPEEAKEPPKLLKGFEKVLVEAGASLAVEFTLTAKDLRVWTDERWSNISGKYVIHVGASSGDIRVVGELYL